MRAFRAQLALCRGGDWPAALMKETEYRVVTVRAWTRWRHCLLL